MQSVIIYVAKTTFHKTDTRQEAKKNQSKYCKQIVSEIACEKLGLKPDEIVFLADENGKPYLKNAPEFHFNISHTNSAVAAAISNKPIGVDIELIKPENSRLMNVAKKMFLPDEFEYITAQDDGANKRFFEIWTRKEAYAKYIGTGIFAKDSEFTPMSFNVLNPGFDGRIDTFFIEGSEFSFVLSVCGEYELVKGEDILVCGKF
ncbi:MAG: 4'-phosphopantetheinyl transferase superfamily protein [Defluviitaleaceae bacterium]|nr:4'-phosphopantetheinyl transferase superfamily protein [Defluviitaleaceae bacterium]